ATIGPGTGITVTVSGLTLAGAQAADYKLPTPQQTTTADITPSVPVTLPTVTVNSLSSMEGTVPGTLTPFVFQVKLSAGGSSKGPVTYDVITTNGTAIGGTHFVQIVAGVNGA